VRDRSNGLISLVSIPTNEAVEPFDMNRFDMLMGEIATETEERTREAMAIDYAFSGNPGSSMMNPLDLTAVWH